MCQNKNGVDVPHFVILTTVANRSIGKLHDRMPVILRKQDESAWLNSDLHNTERLDQRFSPTLLRR